MTPYNGVPRLFPPPARCHQIQWGGGGGNRNVRTSLPGAGPIRWRGGGVVAESFQVPEGTCQSNYLNSGKFVGHFRGIWRSPAIYGHSRKVPQTWQVCLHIQRA